MKMVIANVCFDVGQEDNFDGMNRLQLGTNEIGNILLVSIRIDREHVNWFW